MADDVADERADDDDVVDDEGRRLPAEAVDPRVVVALGQVDLAAVAEVGIAASGLPRSARPAGHRGSPAPGRRRRRSSSRGRASGGLADVPRPRAPAGRRTRPPRRWRRRGPATMPSPVLTYRRPPAIRGVFWDAAGARRSLPAAGGVGDCRLPPHDLEVVDRLGVDLVGAGRTWSWPRRRRRRATRRPGRPSAETAARSIPAQRSATDGRALESFRWGMMDLPRVGTSRASWSRACQANLVRRRALLRPPAPDAPLTALPASVRGGVPRWTARLPLGRFYVSGLLLGVGVGGVLRVRLLRR